MLDILGDPASTGVVIVAVARGDAGQRDASSWSSGCEPRPTSTSAAVVVNRVLPELFGRGEEEVFERAARAGARRARSPTRPAGRSSRCSTPPALAVTLRRTRAGHLGRLRDGVDPTLPILYVPELFTRGHGLRATRQVAEALGAELGSDGAGDRAQAPARSSSCWRPRRSSSPAARAAWARRRRRPPLAPWPRRTSAARCSCSPSTRPGGWPTPWASRRSATSRRGSPPTRSPTAGVEPRASCGRPCSTPSRAGTTSCAATRPTRRPATRSSPTRCTRTSPASSSRATTTSPWSGSTRSTRRATYDLIVVDTPPTRNAIDFLEAPERMADFFSQPPAALAASAPYRSRGSMQRRVEALLPGRRPHPRLAVPRRTSPSSSSSSRRCTTGFVERADAVERLLDDRRTTFVVVTHARGGAGARGRVLHRRARRARSSTSAPSCSTRCCPPTCSTPRRPTAAPRLCDDPDERRRGRRPTTSATRRRSSGCCTRSARASSTSRSSPSARPSSGPSWRRRPTSWRTVPYFDTDIYDLAGPRPPRLDHLALTSSFVR